MALETKLIQGVVFDFDGVLGDTEKTKFLAWKEALARQGFGDLPEDEYVLHFAGKSGKANVKGYNERHGTNVPESIIDHKNDILATWFETRDVELMPYAKEAVQYCTDKGLKLSVATSSSRKEADVKLTKSGLGHRITVTVTNDDVATRKPHPEIYTRAVDLIGLRPNICLAFEDTSEGVVSAKDAGLVCIAVPNKWSRGQDFLRADKTVDNLEQGIAYVRDTYRV